MNKPESINKKSNRRTQAERTALSDQRMFEAAITLINERGTQKTTLKEIGELAGYSRGMANYRFGSKDGLMGELFTNFDGLWKQHLQRYVSDKEGVAAIQAAAEGLLDFLKSESSAMRAMYILWYESLGHDSEIRTRLADHHDVYRSDIRRWFEQALANNEIHETVNSEQFAVQYCAFVFGIVYQWLVNPNAIDLDIAFKDYLNNIFKLLAKQE